jgi:pimeloyl-ACP methyl ester carboxylesterase
MPQVIVDKANNVTLNYQCLGEGEDLLLIHGLGANLAFWYPAIASLLSKHYRVIIYDLRGHGRSAIPDSGYTVTSMAQDLQALLKHLGIGQVHVVGHSFGARIALYYAISNPQQVSSLTIADTQFLCLQPRVRLGEWPYWETWKQQLLKQGVSPPSDDEFISFHLLTYLNQVFTESTQENSARRVRKPSLKTRDMGRKGKARWHQLMSTTTAMQEFERDEEIREEDFKKVIMPTLAMYGEYSHCIPTCWRLQALIPDCNVVIFPDVGHFYPLIRPKRFVHSLWQFLQSHSSISMAPTSLAFERVHLYEKM